MLTIFRRQCDARGLLLKIKRREKSPDEALARYLARDKKFMQLVEILLGDDRPKR